MTTKIKNSEYHNITKNALTVAFFTSISRITGLARDILIFHIFGVGLITDAFFLAFTIPNTLRRFVAEGALTVAFIPVYINVIIKHGVKSAIELLKTTLGFILIFLIILIISGIFGAKYIVYAFASGFACEPNKINMTILLTQIIFPYIAFISLVALSMSVLNAHKHFIAPAASPILLNISIILSTIFLIQLFTEPISAVAIGVVIGGAAQLLFQLPFLAKFNLLVFPKLNFRLSPFKKLLKLLIPSIFGVAIYQLNLIVLRQLGSYLPNGQISYYYNADRLMQCALGIFAFSIATAALPQMSIKSIKDDKNALLNTWIFTTKLTNFITLPASLGLIAISIPLVSILYLHGKFNLYDVKMTAYTTMSFAPGLITTAINRITVQAFFALEDMKTPVYVGTITLFINIIIGLALLPYEIIGLGLTLSISSLIQMLILITLLTMKLNYKNYRKLLFSFIEQFTLAFWAALSAYLITTFGTWELGANIKNLLILSLSLIVSSLIYFILALKLKIYEAQILCNIFILKNKKRYYN